MKNDLKYRKVIHDKILIKMKNIFLTKYSYYMYYMSYILVIFCKSTSYIIHTDKYSIDVSKYN